MLRRDRPGWSRGIRPAIIPAPGADVAAFGRKPHFNQRRSAETLLRRKSRLGDNITDGAYAAMMPIQCILSDHFGNGGAVSRICCNICFCWAFGLPFMAASTSSNNVCCS